ncbi:MAG TPA: aminodeoxychorismate/anthranilate synthase component II [Acidimicrobiales bacterium]|nr:aminodeoxychorismate/anthranilate synthase component II [Acidimicrobiales bacterium]
MQHGVARILVVDNYDSFVYNLVQYLGQLGAEPLVYRNDAIDAATAASLQPDGLLVSPGPGRPESAGASCELIESLALAVPVLGVCLGHQCIGAVYGAEIVRNQVMHGKASEVTHDGRGVFAGLPDPLTAARYHSLVVERATVPPALEVSAWTEDGVVMGLRHRELRVEGVQFHPESIITGGGHRLLANWLSACGQAVPPDVVAGAEASISA